MSTRRRRWPLLLAAVALIAVAVALVLPWALDVERYRPQIERALQSATGWEAELGSIGLGWSGGIAVEVAPAVLSDPAGDSRLAVESISLRAAILPLLRKRLDVREIDLWRPRFDLVKPSEEAGWVLPPLGNPGRSDSSGDGSDVAAASRDPAVAIGSIRVRDGRLHVEDRSVQPATVLDLERVSAAIDPSGSATGSASLGSGIVRWELGGGKPIGVHLEHCPSGPLIQWVGPDLLHPGGDWSGKVTLALPGAVDVDLSGRDVTLLAGEASFEVLQLRLATRAEGEHGWVAQSIELDGDGVSLSGHGPLLPETRLTLRMPDTGVAEATGFARKLFPFPLELEPPGRVALAVTLDAGPGREMTYQAQGRLSAASFSAGAPLPPVEQLEVEFDLAPAGSLEMQIARGTLAGGPLAGALRLDSVVPLGELTFVGRVDRAGFGPMLAGLVTNAASLAGVASVGGQVSLDLAASAGDPKALGGGLEIRAADVRLPGWRLEDAVLGAIEDKLGALGKIAASLLDERKEDEPDPRGDERLFRLLQAGVDLGSVPWRLEPFGLETGTMTASGAGHLDPTTGEIDLNIDLLFTEKATARLLRQQSALRGLVRDGRLELPLTLEGPLAEPSIGVDTSGLSVLDDREKLKGLLEGLLDRAP